MVNCIRIIKMAMRKTSFSPPLSAAAFLRPTTKSIHRNRLIATALVLASLSVPALAQHPCIQQTSAELSSTHKLVIPIASIKLEKFLGPWHEIARIPNWSQKQCVKGAVITYERIGNGSIKIITSCLNRRGTSIERIGTARAVDPSSQTRFKVSHLSQLGCWPHLGDYWIIGLDPEYRWLAVGDPKRQYGWILSRSAVLESTLLEVAFQSLERNGYSRKNFVLTPQS